MTGGSVLVDMSNLVVGGGVQVGASFLGELAQLRGDGESLARWPWLADVRVEVSSIVLQNVDQPLERLDVRQVDGRPRDRLLRRPGRRSYDVSFCLFGPDYGARRARHNIVGFADVTSLFPEFAGITGPRRALHVLRSGVSKARFRSANLVVVESPHVADALTDRWGLERWRLAVVPNVLHQVFTDDARYQALNTTELQGHGRVFAYPSRGYPHKNHDVLGRAATAVAEQGMSVRFAVTLTEEEWGRLSPQTRSACINLGPLTVSQMPSLYDAVDGVVFPSLNECFSVTPLEAMKSRRVLVASDRAFVRDVGGDAPRYFEPTDASSLAEALVDVMTDDVARRHRVDAGGVIADSWATAYDRAVAYLDLIDAGLSSRPGRSE